MTDDKKAAMALRHSLRKEFEKYIEEHEKNKDRVGDGIYDITDIPFVKCDVYNADKYDEVKAWIDTHESFWVCSAYETDEMFLIAEEPKEFSGKLYGSGFNYGSTSIITDCPKAILILAEND